MYEDFGKPGSVCSIEVEIHGEIYEVRDVKMRAGANESTAHHVTGEEEVSAGFSTHSPLVDQPMFSILATSHQDLTDRFTVSFFTV